MIIKLTDKYYDRPAGMVISTFDNMTCEALIDRGVAVEYKDEEDEETEKKKKPMKSYRHPPRDKSMKNRPKIYDSKRWQNL